MEKAEISEKYKALADKVIEDREDLHWLRNADVTIGYIESDRAKVSKGRAVMGECIKVKDLYRAYIPHDFLIVIYIQNVLGLSEQQLEILMYHELLHVSVNEKGVKSVAPHDIEDFENILDKYGLKWAKEGYHEGQVSEVADEGRTDQDTGLGI